MIDRIKILETILTEQGLTFNPSDGKSLGEFANKIYDAAIFCQIQWKAESARLAGDVEGWLSQTEKLAQDLAEKLANPPGNVAFHVSSHFQFSQFRDYGIVSPFELAPMMHELALASSSARSWLAEKHLLGRPALKKQTGESPANRFIIELASIYEQFLSLPAEAKRQKVDDEPATPFVKFVKAVAIAYGGRAPGGEAIKKALKRAK